MHTDPSRVVPEKRDFSSKNLKTAEGVEGEGAASPRKSLLLSLRRILPPWCGSCSSSSFCCCCGCCCCWSCFFIGVAVGFVVLLLVCVLELQKLLLWFSFLPAKVSLLQKIQKMNKWPRLRVSRCLDSQYLFKAKNHKKTFLDD